MEKFLNLTIEKQNTIINAALKCFGSNGYKKTSINDIAIAAGISKAIIFHYFGTKKKLYFYLIELCGNIFTREVEEKFDYKITDFFERIRAASEMEISIMKMYPGITTFLTSVYFEKDAEVNGDIKELLLKSEGFRNKIAFDGMDYSKFKEGIDLKLIMKMLLWLTEGYLNQLKSEIDYDVMLVEFNECLNLLKKNFYKEDFL